MLARSGDSEDHSDRKKFIRIARRIFPNACTFRTYIDDLNSQIQEPEHKICLESTKLPHRSYTRLLDRLYVAWPGQTQYPTLHVSQPAVGFVSTDQVIQNVIIGALRKFPSRYEAQRHNTLCNGFSLGSQHGIGSVFRNLDLRSSSSQIQVLRSPAWKELLQNIGPALLTHLLSQSILLIATSEETQGSFGKLGVSADLPLSSVFIQICGPSPSEYKANASTSSSKGESEIVLRRDILYHNPNQGEKSSHHAEVNIPPTTAAQVSSRCLNSGLPRTHHLQGLSPSRASARILISRIFSGCSPANLLTIRQPDGAGAAKRGPTRGTRWLRERRKVHKRLVGVTPILEEVIRRTNKRSFRRLLGEMCPLPQVSRTRLVDCATNPRDVTRFLIACFRQLAPTALFGSERNRHIYENGIRDLVCRRLKRESFNIRKRVTRRGIILSDLVWLHRPGAHGKKVCNPTDFAFRWLRIEELFEWMFRGVLLPILHQSFYVTDGDLYRNRLFFFRREVWGQLTHAAYENILRNDKKFSVLSKDGLAACTLQRHDSLQKLDPILCPYPVLMHHEFRFVPKRSSLRGIQCIRGKMLRGFSCLKSTHRTILSARDIRFRASGTVRKAKTNMKSASRYILRILSTESHVKSRLGASVFSLDDVFDRFLHLKKKWVQNKRPAMYACSVDITTSFDTIPLGTLFSEVIPVVLTKERYVALRYQIAKASIATGKTRRRCLTHVCTEPGEEASFSGVVRRKLAPDHAGAVFTDLVQRVTISRDQILQFLGEFLRNNLIAVPKSDHSALETGFAVQCRGLPQGNQLSPLLTSLFYAYVERRDLAEFLQGQPQQSELTTPTVDECLCLLMRQVDDTLFLTSRKPRAIQFLQRMVKGWRHSHGFGVNIEKTKTNFKSDFAGKWVKEMAWCGLNIDVATLQVRNDYTRYGQDEGGCVRDALFIEHDTMPGTCFAERAWACFKPKLHALLLDSRINSRRTVALNLYQAALLACLKMSSYAAVIQPREKQLTCVIDVMMSKFVEFVNRAVRSRMAASRRCRLPLSQLELRYLTFHAFQSGIAKRLRQRRKMQKRTESCLRMVQERLDECAECLRKQHDSSMQSVANRINQTYCTSLWRLRL